MTLMSNPRLRRANAGKASTGPWRHTLFDWPPQSLADFATGTSQLQTSSGDLRYRSLRTTLHEAV